MTSWYLAVQLCGSNSYLYLSHTSLTQNLIMLAVVLAVIFGKLSALPIYRTISIRSNGRSGEIRTPDPLVPNQMRYQTALHSADVVSGEIHGYRTPCNS